MLAVQLAAEAAAQQATPIWATILVGIVAMIGTTLGPYFGARAAVRSAGVQAEAARQAAESQAQAANEKLGHDRVVDLRSRWWEETQRALDLCGSDNPRIRVMGLAMLAELAKSTEPSNTERRMVSAAAAAFITEETKLTAGRAATGGRRARTEGAIP